MYFGHRNPRDEPSTVVLCSHGVEGISERIDLTKEEYPEASILVFGLSVDLALAWAALRAGARGFIHAEMSPEQLVRAVEVATAGELVAPRTLLEFLVSSEERTHLRALSARQRQVMGFVVEGLSNAEIGQRLYLSESTIKQHLRSAYKVLGVKNRTEAARLIQESG
ncbi:MAG: response regulator transcription factor [Actinomycetota bacterium]|nr:response regulator transcription factor [Actinomycetota bacterium]